MSKICDYGKIGDNVAKMGDNVAKMGDNVKKYMSLKNMPCHQNVSYNIKKYVMMSQTKESTS